MTIKVVLADDQPLVIKGITRLVNTAEDMAVIAACNDGLQAIVAVRGLRPDVLLLDLKMPRMDGLKVLLEMHKEKLLTKSVLLTSDLDENSAREAMRLGVHGIMLKESAPRFLLPCIREVHAGGRWLDTRHYYPLR